MKSSVWFWVRSIVILLCIFITIVLRVYCICELNNPSAALTFDRIGVCCVIFFGIDIGIHLAT